MSRGLDHLTKLRLAGHKPTAVWVVVGDAEQQKLWQWSDCIVEVAVKNDGASARLDWRPLVGCEVFVLADTATQPLRQIINRLESLAERITVFVSDRLPATIGHTWTKNDGWREVARG